MPGGQPGAAQPEDFSADWPVTIALLAVGAVLFALGFWLLRPWLGFCVHFTSVAPWRPLAVVRSVFSLAVAPCGTWNSAGREAIAAVALLFFATKSPRCAENLEPSTSIAAMFPLVAAIKCLAQNIRSCAYLTAGRNPNGSLQFRLPQS
jgi:hypothetical protein